MNKETFGQNILSYLTYLPKQKAESDFLKTNLL